MVSRWVWPRSVASRKGTKVNRPAIDGTRFAPALYTTGRSSRAGTHLRAHTAAQRIVGVSQLGRCLEIKTNEVLVKKRS